MDSNHPAKIAKYLLKGWCLLNEYCPNGHNVPLVKSKEGALVCAGCDPSCPHYATHGDQGAGPPAPSTGAVPLVSPQPQPSQLIPSLAERPSPAERDRALPGPTPAAAAPALGGGGGGSGYLGCSLSGPSLSAPGLQGNGLHSILVPPAGLGNSRPQESAPAMSARPTVADEETVLQIPEIRFGCTRLHVYGNGRGRGSARLAGDSFCVRVLLGLPPRGTRNGALDVAAMKKMAHSECERLSGRILFPERADAVEISNSAGQIVASCEDGVRFTLPERDCIVSPQFSAQADAAPDEISSLLWERLAGSAGAEGLRRGCVRWMEVRVLEGSTGVEATFRRSLPGAGGAIASTPSLAELAVDW